MLRIGTKLQEERIKRGLSVADVQEELKIKKEFLDAIESGNYNRVPTGAHLQGFVGRYAEYLGLPKRESLALFRREFDTEKAYTVLPNKALSEKQFQPKRLRLSQQALLIVVVFIILISYFLFQYRGIFIPPSATITTPKDNAHLSSSLTIVTGKTDPNNSVSVNSQDTPVNSDGTFTKSVSLFPGIRTIEIIVTNHFGKKTTIDRHVLVPEE